MNEHAILTTGRGVDLTATDEGGPYVVMPWPVDLSQWLLLRTIMTPVSPRPRLVPDQLRAVIMNAEAGS